ncbi:Glycosyl transferase family 2 [Lachnospiraceae bacterium C10]|nr:Glycosyl transferase family 2 [Lachnospiraceae bacterium C10]
MSKSNVAVLLSSYNGEKYIREQLNSVIHQEGVNVDLFVRDDGSTDSTRDILEQEYGEKIHIIQGENIGVIKSFFEIIKVAEKYDYYALCDQDDVWDCDKLQVAVECLDNHQDVEALYLSTTRVVDEQLNVIEETSSRIEKKVYDPIKVLVGNNATGCTMVFNSKLRDLVAAYIPERVIMHDHWIYMICILCGGYVFFDKTPHISYRQHGNNELGNKISFSKRISISSLKKGRRIRSGMLKQINDKYGNYIAPENKKLVYCSAHCNTNIRAKAGLIKYLANSHLRISRKWITIAEVLAGVF